MGRGIYAIQDDGKLVRLEERPYDTEDLLQALLANYPDLLPGEQIDSGAPRRWLLISREMGVPGEEGGSGRWSLDHLFVDQDGVPSLVEVKRSTDTRIRRECVGQMLDYAANAVVYWPIEGIRAQFETRCARDGLNAGTVLAEFVGGETEEEAFWQKVKTNLQAGRIRMLFVADEIPPELRRIVEFLNEQMDPAEVLAVEIRQFVGQGLRTLVPRVMGLTAEAERKKGGSNRGGGRQWDEASFFADMAQRCPAETVEVARKILAWSKAKGLDVWWGKGASYGGFIPVEVESGRRGQLCEVWGSGTYETFFQWHAYRPPFDSEEKRRELLTRYNAIPGVRLPDDAISRRPTIPLTAFHNPAALAGLFDVLDWFIAEMKAVDAPP